MLGYVVKEGQLFILPLPESGKGAGEKNDSSSESLSRVRRGLLEERGSSSVSGFFGGVRGRVLLKVSAGIAALALLGDQAKGLLMSSATPNAVYYRTGRRGL